MLQYLAGIRWEGAFDFPYKYPPPPPPPPPHTHNNILCPLTILYYMLHCTLPHGELQITAAKYNAYYIQLVGYCVQLCCILSLTLLNRAPKMVLVIRTFSMTKEPLKLQRESKGDNNRDKKEEEHLRPKDKLDAHLHSREDLVGFVSEVQRSRNTLWFALGIM